MRLGKFFSCILSYHWAKFKLHRIKDPKGSPSVQFRVLCCPIMFFFSSKRGPLAFRPRNTYVIDKNGDLNNKKGGLNYFCFMWATSQYVILITFASLSLCLRERLLQVICFNKFSAPPCSLSVEASWVNCACCVRVHVTKTTLSLQGESIWTSTLSN